MKMLYVEFENPFFLKNMVVYFLNGGTDVVLVFQGWKRGLVGGC